MLPMDRSAISSLNGEKSHRGRRRVTLVASAEEIAATPTEERNPELPCYGDNLYPGESEVVVARGEILTTSIQQSTEAGNAVL